MSNELTPEGAELLPEVTGEFAAIEEVASEDAGHLLPAIRELPADRELAPGAFFCLRLSDGAPSNPPMLLGERIGASVFQSLTDVHLFGRNAESEPWLEVEAQTPEPVQLMVAQELYTAQGAPLAEDDLGMFDMVASRIAKTLGRTKQPPPEAPAQAATRSGRLASLKGTFNDTYGLVVAGSFDAAKVVDCALCLGMRRQGDRFGWFGSISDDPTFTVHAEPTTLKAGNKGPVGKVHFVFQPSRVAQPAKVLERMFTAANYFIRRIGGSLSKADGSAPPQGLVRGEDPALEAAVRKVTDAGLRPGNIVARRLS